MNGPAPIFPPGLVIVQEILNYVPILPGFITTNPFTFLIPPHHLETEDRVVIALSKRNDPAHFQAIGGFGLSQGSATWFHDLESYSPLGFVEDNDGNIAVFADKSGALEVFVLGAQTGNILLGNERTICSGGLFCEDVIAVDDDYMVLSQIFDFDTQCTSSNLMGSSDVHLTKLDQNFSLSWEKTIQITNEQLPYKIIQTSDGGFAIAARTNQNSKTEMLLIKTDENGDVN